MNIFKVVTLLILCNLWSTFSCNQDVERLWDAIEIIESRNTDLEKRVDKLDAENAELLEQIKLLQSKNLVFEEKLKNVPKTRINADRVSEKGLHVRFGCRDDLIAIQCNTGGFINITDAYYGKREYGCSKTCCGPHPIYDCKEPLSENQPSDWAALLYQCNNKTECQYKYTGRFINTCQPDYVADYMEIDYNCVGEVIAAPIGFSALSYSEGPYQIGDVIMYTFIKSNIGEFYNNELGMFICPLPGVYLFSVSALTDHNTVLEASIYLDEFINAAAYANDYYDQGLEAASALVVTSCEAGQRVWIRASVVSTLRPVGTYNMFSGYMLYESA